MDILKALWRKLDEMFKARKIKEVESWDGAASNYPDAASYCKACLIDANSATGKSGADVIEANCKLPVREAGDAAGVYVRQAVHAAAGGHGITQVTKPADVPEAEWTALVKAAAEELVAAYKGMDEVAPDACYEIAGMAKPERAVGRALELDNAIMSGINTVLEQWPDAYLIDVYLSGAQVVMLFNLGGHIYTMTLTEKEDHTVELGEWTEVVIGAQPAGVTGIGRMKVARQADGQYRWFAKACSAVINKKGEIDSRELFDDFIDRFNKGQGFVLRFFHNKQLELGVGDWLARDDNILLASGLVHDNDLGRAFVDASLKKRGDWGTSIGYWPMSKPEKLRTDEGIEIPVYRKGWMEEVTMLPTTCSCAYFTRIFANVKERTMAIDKRMKDALVTLMGDEAQAEEIVNGLLDDSDETNRAIADGGLLTRETTTEQIPATTTEEATETPPETATIPGEQVEPSVDVEVLKRELEDIKSRLAVTEQHGLHPVDSFDSTLIAVNGALSKLTVLETNVAELKQAVDALKLTDEEKQRTWLADRPANSVTQPVTYRPRTDRRSGEEGTKQSLADVAAGTLAKMPK